MGAAESSERHWDGSMMPSQKGKLVIITGANSGIGFEAAKALAKHGAHVVLAYRNESRRRDAEKVITEELVHVPRDVVGSVEFMKLDVSDPSSVNKFARQCHEKFDHLDLLINNAGLSVPDQRLTSNGVEIQFAVNHLGHFYLTSKLLDLLRCSKSQARVVNVSSLTHYLAWLFLNFSSLGRTGGGFSGYSTSKLSNLLFTYELQRRLHSKQVENVISVAAHPGIAYTNIWQRHFETGYPHWLAKTVLWLVSWMPIMSPEMGALPILYAATMKNVKGGEYYGPNGLLHVRGYPTLETGAKSSHSLENASALWTLSETILGEKFEL
ncbi:unnamed protein product [Peronospora belbahrii]|uniref:Uncharacterized protein n=1 Tax=Peronospora belbahrii TaxID=622444 RepID=A0AAU9LG96_9STRA|nr:unnamed protein product [Peronospora belbahrii]CAH0520960.1 unnamed protein product [Peronospora belbahrii]